MNSPSIVGEVRVSNAVNAAFRRPLPHDIRSPAAELPFNQLVANVDERRTPMWAGPRRGCAFEVLNDPAHFIHCQCHAGADAAVAGDGGGSAFEEVRDATLRRQLVEYVTDGGDDVGAADPGRHGSNEIV